MLEVFYSPAAINDLEEIRDYIAARNSDAAVRFLDAVEETCNRFGQHPNIGTRRDELLPGVRVFPVKKNYAVFYRVQTDSIEIVRVVHAARDFDRLFDF